MHAATRALSVLSILAVGLSVNAQTPKVFTVAGGYLGNGVPATSASLDYPRSIAVDARGDIYVTDDAHCRIRKIGRDGVIASFAGTGICGDSGDGGPAHLAMISPAGITFDAQGNLLIADDSRIRKIAKNGVITTIAGNGTFGYSGDGGPATQASLYYPTSVSSDPSGNVYIEDSYNTVIRMVDTAGNIHTVAGNGTWGFSGDGGPATSAQFGRTPGTVCTDGNGNFYIADTNNYRVRKVDSTGTITTYAGTGSSYPISGNGGPATSANIGAPFGLLLSGGKLYISTNINIWAVDLTSQLINIVAGTNSGGFNGDGNAALSTLFALPWGMAIDHAGDLLVADSSNDRVRKIDSSQIVTTIAGGYIGDGKLGTGASLNSPQHIAFDAAGNLYIADSSANRVRKVSTNGIITTFAGTGITGYSGDSGPASAATLNQPDAVAADGSGNIFVADNGNGVIRKVDASGTISTFVSGISAYSLATDAVGNIYASDFLVVRKITPAGAVSIFAGGCFGFGGDGGPATQACLALPEGMAFDNAGNLYIMDTQNYRVRKVDTNGIISTVAGNGHYGYSGDGGPATSASLGSFCLDVALDRNGNIYIADLINARIRIVDASGTIQTYAGNGNFGYNGNGLAAIQANVAPAGLAINAKGAVYVSDDTARVRKIR
jgi:sugar lactone lactonase YvrE